LIGEVDVPHQTTSVLPPDNHDLPPDNPDEVATATPIPLSHLQLDLEPPAVGWETYLTGRGIAVLTDDLGRKAISRADARQLFDEQRETEARQRELSEQRDREAVEADRVRRAQLWRGMPWWDVGMGISPATAMLQAGYEAERPRSVYTTLLEQELGGEDESLVFHPLRKGES
jgi:hypothetical protein